MNLAPLVRVCVFHRLLSSNLSYHAWARASARTRRRARPNRSPANRQKCKQTSASKLRGMSSHAFTRRHSPFGRWTRTTVDNSLGAQHYCSSGPEAGPPPDGRTPRCVVPIAGFFHAGTRPDHDRGGAARMYLWRRGRWFSHSHPRAADWRAAASGEHGAPRRMSRAWGRQVSGVD